MNRKPLKSPHCDDRGDERKSPRRWCAKLSQEVDSYGGSATGIFQNRASDWALMSLIPSCLVKASN